MLRVANVSVDGSLTLAGDESRAAACFDLRKVRETPRPPAPCGSCRPGRRSASAGRARTQAASDPPRTDDPRELIEERDHVRGRDEVERCVAVGQCRCVPVLERDVLAATGLLPWRARPSPARCRRRPHGPRESAPRSTAPLTPCRCRRRARVSTGPSTVASAASTGANASGLRIVSQHGREHVELLADQRADERPESWEAHGDVRREPRVAAAEPLPQVPHGTSRLIRTSCPARALSVCAALPPFIATATLPYESS